MQWTITMSARIRFFSPKPGCFGFLRGFFFLVVCLFLRLLAHKLQSFNSHSHLWKSLGRVWPGIHHSPLSCFLRVRGRGEREKSLWGKKCRALKVSKWWCVPSTFFSVIVRACISPEITEGIYFYFKIGNVAHLLNKKFVLPIARSLSLSRLPLMTNYANSGYLLNSMCAEPYPTYVGRKKDLASMASALKILKIWWGKAK